MRKIQLLLFVLISLVIVACGGDKDVPDSNIQGINNGCKLPKTLSSFLDNQTIGKVEGSENFINQQNALRDVISIIREESSFPLLTKKEILCYEGHSKKLLPNSQEIEKVFDIIKKLDIEESKTILDKLKKGEIVSEEFHGDGSLRSKNVILKKNNDKLELLIQVNESGDTTTMMVYGDGFGYFALKKDLLSNKKKAYYAKAEIQFENDKENGRIYFQSGSSEEFFSKSGDNIQLFTVPEFPSGNIPIYVFEERDEQIWFESGVWNRIVYRDSKYSNKISFDFLKEKLTQEFISGDVQKQECDYDLKFKDGRRNNGSLELIMIKKNYERIYNSDGNLYWEQDFKKEKKNYYENGNLSRTEVNKGYDTNDLYSGAWGVLYYLRN